MNQTIAAATSAIGKQPREVDARTDPEEVAEVGDQRVVGERVGAQVHVELPLPASVYSERAVDRPRHEAHRDAVQHDRRDDLVRARSSPSGSPGSAA